MKIPLELSLLGLAAGVLGSCGTEVQTQDVASDSAPTVEIATVSYDTVQAPRSWSAQLYVEHDALIIARARGLAESVFVDIGDWVVEGQPLLELEKIDQEIALSDAEELERTTARTRARLEQLASGGIATSADSEQAVMEHERSALAVRKALRNLDLTTAAAPFAGRIAERFVRPLSMVENGDSLFRVSAMSPLRVAVRIPETESEGIGLGTEAIVEGWDNTQAAARVIRLSPTVDPASGTIICVLQLNRNSGMRPGANVTVHLGRQSKTILSISDRAITDGGYVLVSSNGRTRLRPVVIGNALPDGRLEIISGLVAGERIVLGQR